MTTIQTKDLTGAALDWAVAKCVGKKTVRDPMALGDGSWWVIEDTPWPDTPKHRVGTTYSPSTNWAQGGPIIERESIDLTHHNDGAITAVMRFVPPVIKADGYTPLIAAMRCFVASKLGDTIEVPDELIGD